MTTVSIFLIKLYRIIFSPVFGGSCRHYPSCSEYGIEAFEKHGFVKGFYLTARRILRCNPFFEGGFDPVPEISVSSEKLQPNKN